MDPFCATLLRLSSQHTDSTSITDLSLSLKKNLKNKYRRLERQPQLILTPLLKNLALTMTGSLGSSPLPRSLK